MERMSESGLPIEPVYDEEQLTNFRPEEKLGKPGAYPYTRGVYPTMPRDVTLYLQWASLQPDGADTSPTAYDAYLTDLASKQAA